MRVIKAIYLIHKQYKKKKVSFPPPKYFTNGFYYFEIETADGILGYGEISYDMTFFTFLTFSGMSKSSSRDHPGHQITHK